MNKIFSKPLTHTTPESASGRFQGFYLSENPFPPEPLVNRESNDKRINGGIYEDEIRRREYEQIENNFLKPSHSEPGHLRVGFIEDTSYIGRGNGKSAFLVNLQHAINKNYCLDISSGVNKCFSLYVTPEPGGRTKTFGSLVDLLFQAIFEGRLIDECLAALRVEAIVGLYPDFNTEEFTSEDEALRCLNSLDWYNSKGFSYRSVTKQVLRHPSLAALPADFPLYIGYSGFELEICTQSSFADYYKHHLHGPKERLDLLFSHMVRFFLAAGFNGGYIIVDDFERIPDFQSARQKKDFALELRSCLFDGMYESARIGFYTFLLVLHAGVPRLISEAWEASGMAHRSPMLARDFSKHIVPFEKLNSEHAKLLLRVYLDEYRLENCRDGLFPFTESAVKRMGEVSEYNAAKLLRLAYDLLERAVNARPLSEITVEFVDNCLKQQGEAENQKPIASIENASTADLMKKALEG